MSFRKFGENDVIISTMLAYPRSEFFVYAGKTYYNNIPSQLGTAAPDGAAGAFSPVDQVRMTPLGAVSLYEYNIDRPDTTSDNKSIPPQINSNGIDSYTEGVAALVGTGDPQTFVKNTGRVFPWISKDSAGSSFKTISADGYANEFKYGDVIQGTYPLSASVSREYVAGGVATGPSGSLNRHYYSLKNRLNFYGIRSQHYKVTSSYGNKDTQDLNLIAIPSIFFGSRIEPGTVSLKLYWTGSLAGELRDVRQNGELIQVTSGSHAPNGDNSGSVAGVVLYDEGYMVLTGSWALNEDTIPVDGLSDQNPSWIRYAAGAGGDSESGHGKLSSYLTFKGRTETQVMTLFTHAKRGEANFSNNPTYLQYGQDKIQFTSSQVYEENPEQLIANTVSSSYNGYDASFKRSVYVSKIAIYDESKNIIGVATLANPVLKEEDQDYSFKLKLDI
tara:strand:+ start:10699 stop:12033 length:1335 start_codon:yes stop_codon:yes gene_type:complete